MNPQETYERFDRYIRGEMTPQEAGEFEHELTQNRDLEADWQQYLITVDVIKASRKKALKDILQATETSKTTADPTLFRNRFGKYFTYLAAAVFASFLLMYFVINQLYKSNHLAERSQQKQESPKKEGEKTPTAPNTTQQIEKPETPELPIAQDNAPQIVDIAEIQESIELETDDAESIALTQESVPNISRDGELPLVKEELLKRETYVLMLQTPKENIAGKTATDNKTRLNQEVEKKEIASNSQIEKTSDDSTSLRQIAIDVQFWSSPINFKGYKFEGSTYKKRLIMYGLTQATDFRIFFMEINSDLEVYDYFFRNNGLYYKLLESDQGNRFLNYQKIEDPTLINKLK